MVLGLDFDQITCSFNLVENVLATQQLALLATRIAFYHILAWACAEIKILRLLNFFPLCFSPFFLFAAVIDLVLGLLAVKKLLRVIETANFYHRAATVGVVAGKFALSFSLNFLSIFVHI